MRFLAHQTRARRQSWLLLALFIVLLLCLIAAFNGLALLAYWGFGLSGWFDFSIPKQLVVYTSLGLACVVVGAALFEYFKLRSEGAIAIALQLGGTLLSGSRASNFAERQLLNIVEESAIAASIKPPLVYVMREESSINAFAAGSDGSYFVVGVTQGALDLLNREALQGVIAHEISHIVEGDATLNMSLASFNFGLTAIYNLGSAMTHSSAYQPSARVDLFAYAFQGLGYTGVLAGRILQAAVSREREFLADAGAVKLTRNPMGLATALRKIGAQALANREEAGLKSPYSEAFGYAFFATAYASSKAESHWLDTHPPLKERLRRLIVSR